MGRVLFPSLAYLMTIPSCTRFLDLCSQLHFFGMFVHFSFFPKLTSLLWIANTNSIFLPLVINLILNKIYYYWSIISYPLSKNFIETAYTRE